MTKIVPDLNVIETATSELEALELTALKLAVSVGNAPEGVTGDGTANSKISRRRSSLPVMVTRPKDTVNTMAGLVFVSFEAEMHLSQANQHLQMCILQ